MDPRVQKTAEILVDYSMEVKAGDRVQINVDYLGVPLAKEVYRLCLERGAHPWVKIHHDDFSYLFYKYAREDQLKWFPEHAMFEIKHTDAWLYIRAPTNTRLLTSAPPEKLSAHSRTLAPILEHRVENTRWVLVDYPTPALAQEAEMSVEEYEEFVFGAVIQDWEALAARWREIADVLRKTDEVRIVGKETDVTFSVKGRTPVVADGKHNMPDGEVFTSVVEESVEGKIFFDVPVTYRGRLVSNVVLKFKEGEVVSASAEQGEQLLSKLLDTDEGARRLGEFGIGLNYKITRPTRNILFDEKIGGTVHLAIGRSYGETGGKNESAIHFDLIKDLRQEGEIYFDGEKVFERGEWLI